MRASYLKRKRFISEPKIFCWNKSSQENIDAFSNREWQGNHPISTWLSIQAANEVGQVIQDTQVVFNNDDIAETEIALDKGSLAKL